MNQLSRSVLLSLIVAPAFSISARAACEAENARIEKGAPGCGPKREEIPIFHLQGGAHGVSMSGMYMKTHPSGEFVIVSGPTGMIDLTQRGACGETVPRYIPSPMNSEVAPVEGKEGWTLLASPNHQDGMRYFRFDEVLSSEQSAQADFADYSHNQYYQSASEMEGSSKDKIKFRTVLYTGARYKDYEATRGSDGKFKITQSSEQGSLCSKLIDPKAAIVPTSAELERRRTRYEEVRSRRIQIGDIYQNASAQDQARLSEEYFRLSQEMNELQPPSDVTHQIHNPVLSKDGKEISFLSGANPTLKIAKIINGTDCEIIHDLKYQAGKGSFSRPEGSKKGVYVFPATVTDIDSTTGQVRYKSGIFVLNKDNGKVTQISEKGGQYPGITKDGRVIYVDYGPSGMGRSLQVVDLNQLEGGDISKCAKAKTSGASSRGGRQ